MPRFAKSLREGNWRAIAKYPAPLRIFVFLAGLALIWLPVAIPIYWLGGVENANAASILALTLLYSEFIVLLRIWGRRVSQTPTPLQACGLSWTSQNGKDLLSGLLLGLMGVLSLFALEILLGWAVWQSLSTDLWRIGLEGLLVALGIGFVEELFFRGWLLTELEKDYSKSRALWFNTVIFSLAHFIRPLSEVIRTLPQFLGLVLLGITLIWAKRLSRWSVNARNREVVEQLGFPIGLHAGLVWGYYLAAVGGLIQYSRRVPEWVTGIGQNPLAGVLGIFLLGLIAAGLRMQKRGH